MLTLGIAVVIFLLLVGGGAGLLGHMTDRALGLKTKEEKAEAAKRYSSMRSRGSHVDSHGQTHNGQYWS